MTGAAFPGETIAAIVRRIHGENGKVCIVVTGAGTQAVSWLFAEAGASRTVIDAQVPYSSNALNHYTGKVAEQHVSAEEAALMAETALERAIDLTSPDERPVAGVSCTAAIATDRVRRGENRCHVAVATSTGTRKTYSLVMRKGERDRAGEEAVCSAMVLNAVAEAKGVDSRLDLRLLDGEEVIERDES